MKYNKGIMPITIILIVVGVLILSGGIYFLIDKLLIQKEKARPAEIPFSTPSPVSSSPAIVSTSSPIVSSPKSIPQSPTPETTTITYQIPLYGFEIDIPKNLEYRWTSFEKTPYGGPNNSFFELDLNVKDKKDSTITIKAYHFEDPAEYLGIKYLQPGAKEEIYEVNGITWHKYPNFAYAKRNEVFLVRGRQYYPIFDVSTSDQEVLKLIRFIKQDPNVPALGLYPDGPNRNERFDASSDISRALFFETVRKALQEYEAKTGKYPLILDELVPLFLPFNPKDAALENRCNLYLYNRLEIDGKRGYEFVVPLQRDHKISCDVLEGEYTCEEGNSYSMDPPGGSKTIKDLDGHSYLANEISVRFKDEAMRQDAEELANQLDACIIGYVPSSIKLTGFFVDAPTIETLDMMIKKIEDFQNPLVENAMKNPILRWY